MSQGPAIGIQGNRGDAAATTDTGTFSRQSLFKRLLARLTALIGLFPTSLGRKPSTASLAVVLSDEQEEILDRLGATVTATNAIADTAYDLQAAAYSATTALTNDYILNKIEFKFSTAASRTITITRSDGSIFYQDTNTVLDLDIEEIDEAFNGGENFTIAITQTASACTVTLRAVVLEGTMTLGGNPTVDQGTTPWIIAGSMVNF